MKAISSHVVRYAAHFNCFFFQVTVSPSASTLQCPDYVEVNAKFTCNFTVYNGADMNIHVTMSDGTTKKYVGAGNFGFV